MKPLRMTVPARLRPHLLRLLKEGLSGSTERQVALRLMEESLRDAARVAAKNQHRGLFG